MGTKLRCTFEMEIDVEFADPKAAEAYFLDGDWKESFYDLADLEALAVAVARGFHHETDRWDSDRKCWVRFVEGFGAFAAVKDDPSTFRLTDDFAKDGGGHILVRYESELDDSGCCEV